MLNQSHWFLVKAEAGCEHPLRRKLYSSSIGNVLFSAVSNLASFRIRKEGRKLYYLRVSRDWEVSGAWVAFSHNISAWIQSLLDLCPSILRRWDLGAKEASSSRRARSSSILAWINNSWIRAVHLTKEWRKESTRFSMFKSRSTNLVAQWALAKSNRSPNTSLNSPSG